MFWYNVAEGYLYQGSCRTGDRAATDAEVAAWQLKALCNALTSAGSAVCSQIVAAIMPDPTHQAAFQNAASIINGNGGTAPASGALATKFAALASAYGLSAANFATLILTLQGASLDLSNVLLALQTAVGASTTAAQLASALSAFETAIGNVVSEVNAAIPTPLTAPALISIAGINA